MLPPFLEEEDLAKRIANAMQPNARPIVFMLGSAASMPRRSGGVGIPTVSTMLDMVRAALGEGDSRQPEATYQDAFLALVQRQGHDVANRIVQRSVLMARTQGTQEIPADASTLANLEEDVGAWWIPDGLHALACLIAHYPSKFGKTVLTTNFDPLIEIALSRAHATWFSNSLHSDGSLLYLRGGGTHVVHLHGHWWGSDTLHTGVQLTSPRRQLAASLRTLLAHNTVVVLGYGGWDDVFMSALGAVASENAIGTDILWGFFAQDEALIRSRSAHVLGQLEPAATRHRCFFYKGINFDSVMVRALRLALDARPAESLPLFLKRLALRGTPAGRFPHGAGHLWEDADTLAESIKALEPFGVSLPSRAALIGIQYLLPRIERQPIHSAPSPRQLGWVREALSNAFGLLEAPDEVAKERAYRDVDRLDSAAGDHDSVSFEHHALEATADAIWSVITFIDGPRHRSNGVPWATTSAHWAAAAVHEVSRATHDDERGLLAYIAVRLRENERS